MLLKAAEKPGQQGRSKKLPLWGRRERVHLPARSDEICFDADLQSRPRRSKCCSA